jgi:hypothetical protein
MYEYKFKVNRTAPTGITATLGSRSRSAYTVRWSSMPRPEPFSYDRDYVVMLSDWTDEDPTRVLAKLKKQSDYYNFTSAPLATSSTT